MPRKQRKGGGGVGGGASSSGLVWQMKAYYSKLASQCEAIQSEMEALSGAMKVLGAAPARTVSGKKASKSGPRLTGIPVRGPRGEGQSLKDFIRRVLTAARRPMRVVDITTGVKRIGYQSSSQNLANQVSMALADMSKKKLVKKVDRGNFSV
jgi:hypothetical protein